MFEYNKKYNYNVEEKSREYNIKLFDKDFNLLSRKYFYTSYELTNEFIKMFVEEMINQYERI